MTGSADSYDRLLRELAEERVAALNRIARRLEQRIEALKALRASVEDVAGDESGFGQGGSANEPSAHGPSEGRRAALLQRYRELRVEALRYRWYLDVQREALGLRPHEMVEQFYSVPGPLDG